MMSDIREYCDRSGRSPFREWFKSLDAEAARKIKTALYRISPGNFSNVKGVGAGVYEHRIHFSPGYRVYFGKAGEQIVILLAGGTKKRQPEDVRVAIERWQDYKQRTSKQQERE